MSTSFEGGPTRTLGDYIDIVLARRWTILGVFGGVVLVSVIYALSCTPLFTSVARIEFEEKKAKPATDSLYGNPEYDQIKSYLATQIEILKSRSLVEALINRMNLLESPHFSSTRTGWVRSVTSLSHNVLSWFRPENEEIATSASSAKMNVLVSRILDGIAVKPVKTSNLVAVSTTATSRTLAKDMLNNYLLLYLERNLDARRRESLEASAWLREEVAKAEKKLLESQAALVGFIVDHGVVSADEGGLGQVVDLMNKTMEGRMRSQDARLRVQALKDQTTSGQGVLLPKDANTEYVGKLKEQLALNESEYTQMKGVYSPRYPKMTALRQKIDFLRERITQIEKNIVNSTLDTAKREESLFKDSFDKARHEAERVKSLEAQHALLKKEVETNTEFHKILLKEFKEQEIKSRTIANNVRIVDPPGLPTSPSWPRKRFILVMGCLIGLIAGIGAALVVDTLDHTVRSPQEIETVFQVPRLAVVPDLARLRPGNSAEIVPTDFEFVAHLQPRSVMADAIRNLQTSIFLANPDQIVSCMVVSSANPGQGKTLIAVSTATILSSEGKSVVVVDGDMRRPRLHSVFGLQAPSKGLSDFLRSDIITLPEVTRRSKIPGLSYITSGAIPDNPVILLRSERMTHLVEELKASYDYVVFDSPPVLGFSDTQMICLHSDGIVMVARQGHVIRDELQEAIKVVSNVDGCHLLGVVMNRAHASGGGYGYGYGKGYHYGYHDYYRAKS